MELRKYLPKNDEEIGFNVKDDKGKDVKSDVHFFEFPGHESSHIRLVTGGFLIRAYYNFEKPVDKRGYMLVFVPLTVERGKAKIHEVRVPFVEIRDLGVGIFHAFGGDIPGQFDKAINKERAAFEKRLNDATEKIIPKAALRAGAEQISARCENGEVVFVQK